MAVELARDLVRTQDQLGPRDSTNLVFKLFNDQMPTVFWTTTKVEQDIGNAFVVGHATNGVIGVANGVGSGQITIGTGDLGSSSTTRVFSGATGFKEALRDNSYIDTVNTTASVVTSSPYQVLFDATEVLQSKSVELGNGNISRATLYIPSEAISGTSLTYQLSVNGGSNWESVSLNQEHTFTNTGDDLRYKITAGATASSVTVRDTSTGYDYPITLKFTR